MTEFDKSQSTNKKPNYINPANFNALKKFMDNAALKHNGTFGKFYLDDPTTVGFSLWFDPSSPLFNYNSDSGESAYNYLQYSGEQVRAEKLFRFIQQFMLLAAEYPHFFLTLSGLGNIYEFPTGRSTTERTLSFTTNESMDLRIAALVENYIQATYNIEYRRRTVPINLTEFKMRIMVSEIRSFRSFLGKTAQGVDKDGFREINSNLGVYMIDFNRCTFDFSESNPFLETINNSQPEIAENSFKINVGDMNFNNNKVDVFEMFAKPQEVDGVVDIPNQDKKYTSRINKLTNDLKGKARSTITNDIDQLVTDYNPANVTGQLVNKYFTSVIDGKFKQAVLGNVFFTEQIPSGANLVSDTLSGNAPNVSGVLAGRTGDPQKMMSDAILGNNNNLSSRDKKSASDISTERENVFSIDNLPAKDQSPGKRELLFKTLGEVFDNADKLEPQEIETIIEYFTKSSLGNIFTSGNNIS